MLYKGKIYGKIGEIFNEPIRLLKNGEKEEAISFFKEYIRHIREYNGCSTECAESIAKANFRYYAGYCDEETIKLVKENFGVSAKFF